MKTKQDIQLELLHEIDKISEENNLNYILIGKNGLNAYLNNTIKNASLFTSIAMPRGDMDRFYKIIENKYSKNRYVEKFYKKNYLNYISYGNRNTADINTIKLNEQQHHGIQIRIFPIYQYKNSAGKKISRKNLDKKITVTKSYNNKFKNFINRFLKRNVLRYRVDDWSHIKYFSQVQIVNTTFDSEIFESIKKINVDGIKLSILNDADSFFQRIFGINFKNYEFTPSIPSNKVILRTNKSYVKILNQIDDILIEINELNDEIEESVQKFENERNEVIKVQILVKMTDEQIRFIDYFENKIEYLLSLNLNDKKQYNELYMELVPVIDSLKKYSKYGMTFSIDERLDELIEKVLINENEQYFVDKIKELSQKEYFVE